MKTRFRKLRLPKEIRLNRLSVLPSIEAMVANDRGDYVALSGDWKVVARGQNQDAVRITAIARGEPVPVVVYAPPIVHENPASTDEEVWAHGDSMSEWE